MRRHLASAHICRLDRVALKDASQLFVRIFLLREGRGVGRGREKEQERGGRERGREREGGGGAGSAGQDEENRQEGECWQQS